MTRALIALIPMVMSAAALAAEPSTQPAASTRPDARVAAATQPADLIGLLGDRAYRVREAATDRLIAMGKAVVPVVSAKLKEPDLDPEVADRLKKVLTKLDPPKDGGKSVVDPATGVTISIQPDGSVAGTKDGNVLWKMRMGTPAETLRVVDGLVIIAPRNAAVDPATGKMIWDRPNVKH